MIVTKITNSNKEIENYKKAYQILNLLREHLEAKVNSYKLNLAKGQEYSEKYHAVINEDLELLEVIDGIKETNGVI